jgi:hypothetical protein
MGPLFVSKADCSVPQKSRLRAEAALFNVYAKSNLKIIKRLAACHDSSGDAGGIAEGRLVMTDLVAQIESEGEPLNVEVLQAAPKFPVKTVWLRPGSVSVKFEFN